MSKDLILASASPRRKQLLQDAIPGIHLIIEPADIDETRHPNEDAEAFVKRMAFEKARHVAEKHKDESHLVLAADTIVVHRNEILGKPVNAEHARQMLESLSNEQHVVMTAVSLIYRGYQKVFVTKTTVKFARLSPERIQSYIDSGEPMDKAGAYGIQGKAAGFVEWIQGSYTCVVGLPLAETIESIEDFLRDK